MSKDEEVVEVAEAAKAETPIKRTRSYVEEVFQQITTKPNIDEIIILNKNGNPVKTTMDIGKAIKVGGLFETLRDRVTRDLLKMDSNDELLMLRVRSVTNETLVTPDDKITIIVVQSAQDKMHV